MIAIAKPFLGEEEKNAVMAVLDSGMITSGAVVTEFEEKFAEYIGVKYGVAASNGTTALELALRAAGIGKGDKVLTTPFSFIASTNAILYVGGIPVFADIDPHTFNIDPALMEEQLKADPEIKALLIVHLFGHPCDMNAILALTEKYGVVLIEDSAQAHGAMYGGKNVSTFGKVAAYSFYPTKNMTTSEGGMVLTNDAKIAEKARLLVSHGMKVRYYHDEIGYNYRMTNITAAIGLCQLEKLDGFNQKRSEIAKFYEKNIRNEHLTLPSTKENCRHCFHQYSLLIGNDNRNSFLKYLEAEGVGYGVFYPLSIPEQACYKSLGFKTDYPITNRIKKEIVSIPVHPMLTQAEVEKVAEVINKFEVEYEI